MEAMRRTDQDQTAVWGAVGATGRPEMVAARRAEKAPPDPEVPEKPSCRRTW
jgi:hypothetical protein